MSDIDSKKLSDKTSDQIGADTDQSDPGRLTSLIAARAILEKKAENVKILDLRKQNSFTDYFVIASGLSERQVRAMAENAMDDLRQEGISISAVEGLQDGRWILIDTGDTVIHLFLDPIRDYYDLESLYKSAPKVSIPTEFYVGGSDLDLN